MNIDVDKFVVIPNALDSSKFRQSSSCSKSTPLKLITVGRLFYRKGVDLLVDIIPTLFEQNKSIEWTIIGDGPKKYLLDYLV